MRSILQHLVLMLLSLLLIGNAAGKEEQKPRVLFLTHSAGYVHGVVRRAQPDALSHAETQLVEAARDRFEVTATQDVGYLTKEKLEAFDAVVFYTTGELPVDDASKRALIDFVEAGGGFVGSHCATDTFYEYAPYGEMIGGYFDGHPWNQPVRVRVEDADHPATKHLGQAFEIHDEIYQFKSWSRESVRVLASLDIESVDMTRKGIKREDKDFALSWCKPFGKGRVFYTALGHHGHVWKDPRFLTHLIEGIAWTIEKRAPTPPATPASEPVDRRPDAEGYVPLFDADVGTAGWKQAGPGRFDVKDGVATANGGMGLWYFAERSFENFILRLDFKQNTRQANSGVFVRFPRVDGDPWLPVKEGYEIQIQGDVPSKSNTGSVYTFQAPSRVPLRPPGEWNQFEITCIGQQYSVRLNGALINQYTGERAMKGMVGLQNHQGWKDSAVQFRKVRIKELPKDADAYHVLYDGTTLDAWHMCGPGEFRAIDGLLTTHGGMGMLWHKQAFQDFVLLLDWRVERPRDNSGVFLRFPNPGEDPWVAAKNGYEIQICDIAGPTHRTGSVYDMCDARWVPTRVPGQWNHYEIEVRGQQYVVRVNGKKVNAYTGDRLTEGFIGLQNHDPESRVQFKDIRVVSLKKE